MRRQTISLLILLLFALALSAYGQADIPRYTVVPVTLETELSSATASVGDTFYTTCSGENCGGFPDGTRFTGTVTSVTRKMGSSPGQIEVAFTRAMLPNGPTIDITGRLTSLDSKSVQTDPETGRMTGATSTRDERNKFIGYGAGAGLVIGILTDNAIKGALLGAAAGWLYGATIGRDRQPQEAVVPAGTKFGILLTQPVDLPTSVGAGPTPGRGPGEMDVAYSGMNRPYTDAEGVLMVPFRDTLDQLDVPFTYSAGTKSVYVQTDHGQISHALASRLIYVNGEAQTLTTKSAVRGGTLYVPSDVIRLITDKPVIWYPQTRTLRVG